ncbi:chromosomal replication initiator DnaA [Brevundimonas albigilva]|uniref:chromosomal replication initiator DnaA n=1 Tax=Brevundimonas TaxID=41275 RepID=UPI00201B690F|nr:MULTISPECIES: chromosomal replication initiator DnaA [Brevundimonas]UQV19298.1 chromosomal replication initiator DnaA [Brevundimonas albigilva]
MPVSAEDRVRAGVAMHLVAARTGARPDRMIGGGRLDPRTSKARWLAMYLSHVAFGWTLERVGHVFGLNRATAGAACRWAEDARDSLAIDDLLNELETCIQALYQAPRCELAQ